MFVVSEGDAFQLNESVCAWIFGEVITSPGAPGTWAGARANFVPGDLIGDKQHNLAREW